eukprot:6180682-Pleurochrysis_carterae.AAC.4
MQPGTLMKAARDTSKQLFTSTALSDVCLQPSTDRGTTPATTVSLDRLNTAKLSTSVPAQPKCKRQTGTRLNDVQQQGEL